MAPCQICLLNPTGMTLLTRSCNGGCKSCKQRCNEEAFYIGGLNVCPKHKEAYHNRMEEVLKRCVILELQNV